MLEKDNQEYTYDVDYIRYVDSVLFWKRLTKDSYPEVIDVLEDDFVADTIIIVVDSKRFEVSDFPEMFHGFYLSIIDVYEYVKSLENLRAQIALHNSSSINQEYGFENSLNFYTKLIKDYENDLELRRS